LLLRRCCLQLKAKIVKQRALADEREKKKNLTKYIPDVSRALIGSPARRAHRCPPQLDGGGAVSVGMMSQLAEAGGEAGGGRQRARPRDAEHDALLEQARAAVWGRGGAGRGGAGGEGSGRAYAPPPSPRA